MKEREKRRFLIAERLPSLHEGVHKVYRFPNGYGASVVQNARFSYGGEDGLWEVGVIRFSEDGEWDLDCSTPITRDVLGYLTDFEVDKTLDAIRKLKRVKLLKSRSDGGDNDDIGQVRESDH
jgi:hypothetical protein